MRVLGLDLGTKTLGVALGDDKTCISTPFKTIFFQNYDELAREVLKIIEEEEIKAIALGLPKNMDNSLGFASKRSLDFKDFLEAKINIPITLVDERLSTMEAINYLNTTNTRGKKRKQVVDSVAASIILDTYLKMEGNKK